MENNILVLGGGGREDAIVSKLVESAKCKQCFVLPGNPGTALKATNLEGALHDFTLISKAITQHQIDMVIVGPEVPLVDGITDFLKELHPQLNIIGPSKKGAELEGSKAVAKAFMAKYNIPTAGYIEVTSSNLDVGLAHIASSNPPYVLKADGLASGKGVLIIDNKEEAKEELAAMIEGKFGDASSKVVIEDFLDGIEFSVFALTDGKDYVLLPEAKDYKRIGEGDTGLNTGGMGAVSPVPFFTGEFKQKVIDSIIKPTIDGLADSQLDFKGFVFFGLIKVGDEPMVIEYNCRMGDPETEAVFPRIKSDMVEVFDAVGKGTLGDIVLEVSDQHAGTIIMVSGGYPSDFTKGYAISGIEQVQGSTVFHSGTAMKDGVLVNSGGRVLAVTTLANHFKDAVSTSLSNVDKISWQDKFYRTDIGKDLL